MIYGIFHRGSGLGNQLHRYVGTKVLALRKGEEHSMVAQDLFKGKDLFNLNLPSDNIEYIIEEPAGKVVANVDTIDGEFQNEYYFTEHVDKIREWLKVEPLEMPDDVCVINFRGGEYVGVPSLFLPKEYWDKAIAEMRKINPNMQFEVHTDDIKIAKYFFPDYSIIKDIDLNWRAIRYAKYLILSNSSFAILPAHLNENAEMIIAPRYWARYNTKEWINTDNNYKKFKYIHHED